MDGGFVTAPRGAITDCTANGKWRIAESHPTSKWKMIRHPSQPGAILQLEKAVQVTARSAEEIAGRDSRSSARIRIIIRSQ